MLDKFTSKLKAERNGLLRMLISHLELQTSQKPSLAQVKLKINLYLLEITELSIYSRMRRHSRPNLRHMM
jgi:hypothetical protein